MQISVDVHNYMETLVGAKLAKLEYTEKYDHEQFGGFGVYRFKPTASGLYPS